MPHRPPAAYEGQRPLPPLRPLFDDVTSAPVGVDPGVRQALTDRLTALVEVAVEDVEAAEDDAPPPAHRSTYPPKPR